MSQLLIKQSPHKLQNQNHTSHACCSLFHVGEKDLDPGLTSEKRYFSNTLKKNTCLEQSQLLSELKWFIHL